MANIDKVRLNGLTVKYLLGTLTAQERNELDAILDQDPIFRQRFEQRVDRDRLKKQLGTYLEVQQHMSVPGQPARLHLIRRYLPYAAAAFILILIGLVLSQRRGPKSPLQHDPIIAMQYEVQPGANRATLTLGNGTIINLDSAKKGIVSKQADVSVVKTDDGRITYAPARDAAASTTWNIISTPRGGTYQVTLPDGSRAWLNAASTIRFPTSFTSGPRRAEITGEVYFDIAHDPAKPFYVSSGAANVQVLGTEFDIRHYDNEPTSKVTLVNGSVRVQSGPQQKILMPGQQALLTPATTLSLIDHPDIDQATAWKNGFFKFKDADIRSIMREVERWYDVDVVYEITDYSMTYGGRISRGLPLSQLLRLLQGNNIHHYKMEGRKLIVLP